MYLLGSALPVADSVSAVTLDRGLYVLTSALVSVAGIVTALFLLPLSATWRLYASLFASSLAILLGMTAVAFQRRWSVFSGTATRDRALPWFKNWLDGKQSVFESARAIFSPSARKPPRLWASLTLKMGGVAWQSSEVYLLLHFMGARTGLLGAFVLEAFTKLINVVGALNPGTSGPMRAERHARSVTWYYRRRRIDPGTVPASADRFLESHGVPVFDCDVEISTASTPESPGTV